jgi:hypothetical protein
MKSKLFSIGLVVLAIIALGCAISPVSAASNATLTYSGNLQQQVSVSATGNETPFNLALGDNQFNNRSIVYSCNIPIKFVGTDVSPGKSINNTGYFTQHDGMGYLTTKLGSPLNVSLGAYQGKTLVTPADLSGPINPVVNANLAVTVRQFVDWSDPVALGSNVYKSTLDFTAVVI